MKKLVKQLSTEIFLTKLVNISQNYFISLPLKYHDINNTSQIYKINM